MIMEGVKAMIVLQQVTWHLSTKGGSPCGIMAKVLDCSLKASGFKLQLDFYVHFQTNTLGKDLNPHIHPGMD